jgi:acyl dehydratase
MTTWFADLDAVRRAVGSAFGPSDPLTIDQRSIDDFAALTNDHQWVHVDVERATAGPYSGTIAHGFLTVSLITPLVRSLWDVCDQTSVNYGFDRVRLLAPVPSGAAVAARCEIAETREKPGGLLVRTDVTVSSSESAVCAAQWWVYYPEEK